MPTINIRIDNETKKKASKILRSLGLDMSSGVKIFLNQVIKNGGLPFTPSKNNSKNSRSTFENNANNNRDNNTNNLLINAPIEREREAIVSGISSPAEKLSKLLQKKPLSRKDQSRKTTRRSVRKSPGLFSNFLRLLD